MEDKIIVIGSLPKGLCLATIENNRVVELQYEEDNEKDNFSIGDIYIGRVQKMVPSLNAAFIQINPDTPCYYDLKKHYNPIFTHKIGNKPLCEAEQLLVQIEKEAVKSKAPTITTNLNFTGHYVVLTSGNTKISVSSKIQDANRKRLQMLLKQHASEDYGLIARTNAQNAPEQVISAEIYSLIEEYKDIKSKAATRTCYTCMRKATIPYLSYIRDINKKEISKIQIDNESIYQEVQAYIKREIPDLLDKLEFYNDSSYSLNKLYSLEQRMQDVFQKKVWMKSGAYLVIEPTEALTVIDVNSGKCVTKKDKEEQYFRINMESAIEAAYQIRLRNISGIVIIDFINLKDDSKMQQILQKLKECLQNDRIPTKLIGVTKLQLVEITRKKSKKTLQESLRDYYEQERTQN